jgi:stage V sporulation protein B
MLPHVLSNILENIMRLLIIIIIVPKLNNLNTKDLVFFIVLSNIISEGISTLVLYFFLPNKINIKNLSYEKELTKETFQLSIPNISGSIIGNISYFLEPILITSILTNIGLSTNYIIREYGIINGYILPFLMIPSFFSIALSQAALPYLSRSYQEKDYKRMKNQLTKIILFLIFFGITMTILLETKGEVFLKLFYKNSLGYHYLRVLSPIFILYYIEHPLIFTLHSMGKTKDLLVLSILNLITKIVCYLLLSLLLPSIYMYIGTIIINIIITNFYLIFTLKQKLRQ